MTLASLNLWVIAPEILLSVVACLVLLIDLFVPADRRPGVGYPLALLALLGAALASLMGLDSGYTTALNDLVISDGVGAVLKAGTGIGAAVVLIYSREYARARGLWRGEYLVLILFAVVGMMTMIGANHLVTLYVGLELLALCLYSMIGMQRDSVRAAEAAMKYFVLGALASGILLYGMSLLYGLTGSLSLAELASASGELAPTNLPLLTAVVLIVAGLLFKLGVVPFHMWVPDVYDGSATSTTLFLSSVPKLAAFAIMLRLLAYGLGEWVSAWQDMLAIAAVLSISVGNIVAIAQTSLKRMLGYSTISHMGFLLLGFLGGTAHGYSASLSYVVIYTVITLGAFGIILLLSKPQFEFDALSDLKGLNHSRPGLAFLMLIVMFSLAGVPPTAGFFAKLLVLQSALENGFLWTVIVAAVMAVVGAFYYLRVVKLMYFDLPDKDGQVISAPKVDRDFTAARWVLTANVLSLVLVVPWVGNLVDWLTRTLGDFGRL